ncbi:hypothetical protein Tco_1445862 [Tanacetum coccineum]
MYSPTRCRWGIVSPWTCRRGKDDYVAGDSCECCSAPNTLRESYKEGPYDDDPYDDDDDAHKEFIEAQMMLFNKFDINLRDQARR